MSGTVVEVEAKISASPDVVRKYMHDSERLGRWLLAEVLLDARVGGHFEVLFRGSANRVDGDVLELEEDRILATWGLGEGSPDHDKIPPGSSKIEFCIVAEPEGTRFKIRHEGLPEDQVKDHESGWLFYLTQLSPLASSEHFSKKLPTAIEDFTAAWNETDAAARRALLERCVTTDFVHEGLHGESTSVEEFGAHIANVQRFMPNHEVERTGLPRLSRSRALSDWKIVNHGDDDKVVVRGTDLLELKLDGKIARVTSFHSA